MKMWKVTKSLKFDYAHRLYGYEGKCAMVHGHTGCVEVTIASSVLDKDGFVVDFGVLKSYINDFVDTNWDHHCLVNELDTELRSLPGVVMLQLNPTAERLAEILYGYLCDCFRKTHPSLTVECVRFYETPDSWVVYSEK